jgi:hypothetical protein
MQPSSYVPSFYFYKLADAISAPYTSLDAYRAGAIDSSGNLLKPVSSIDSFEFLVIKLKQIFDQLPYGTTKAKLSNYLATLNLFSEEVEAYEITQEQFHCLVEGIVCHNTNNEVSYLELLEDMSTGGGAGALGVPAQGGNINQGGVSGYDIRMKLPVMKRKKGDYFDNCEIFDVCPDEFSSFMNSKQWKDVPDSETKNYLRRFQRRNKNGKIGVRGLNPVSGEQDLFWITYPAKNFMEDASSELLVKILIEKILTPGEEPSLDFTPENIKFVLDGLQKKHLEYVGEVARDPSKHKKGAESEYLGRIVHAINGLHSLSKSKKATDIEKKLYLGKLSSIASKDSNDPGDDAYDWSEENGIHPVDIKQINSTFRKGISKEDLQEPNFPNDLKAAAERVSNMPIDAPSKEKEDIRNHLRSASSGEEAQNFLAQLHGGKVQATQSISKEIPITKKGTIDKSPFLAGKIIPAEGVKLWYGSDAASEGIRSDATIHYKMGFDEWQSAVRTAEKQGQKGPQKTQSTVRIRRPEYTGTEARGRTLLKLMSQRKMQEPKELALSSSHLTTLHDLVGDKKYVEQLFQANPKLSDFIQDQS